MTMVYRQCKLRRGTGTLFNGSVAQLPERLTAQSAEVGGSSPPRSTRLRVGISFGQRRFLNYSHRRLIYLPPKVTCN